MRTYVIGRSQNADIVIASATVAARHAELVVCDDRRLHLTDCASAGGTWRRSSASPGADWEKVRQEFIARDDIIRFGDYVCAVSSLLQLDKDNDPQIGGASLLKGRQESESQHPRGRVERDPNTGEIVRKRH